MKIRTTMRIKGQPAHRGAVGEFDTLAGAVSFAGRYMELVPQAHQNVTAVKFEIVPAVRRRRKKP